MVSLMGFREINKTGMFFLFSYFKRICAITTKDRSPMRVNSKRMASNQAKTFSIVSTASSPPGKRRTGAHRRAILIAMITKRKE